MEKYLNIKETTLLEYIATHYKSTLEVKFKIPLNTQKEIGIKDSI